MCQMCHDEDGHVGPTRDIVRGNWIDVPGSIGFKDRPGIYLIRAGSNSAYGNHVGGFETVAAAEAFNRDRLDGAFRVQQNG